MMRKIKSRLRRLFCVEPRVDGETSKTSPRRACTPTAGCLCRKGRRIIDGKFAPMGTEMHFIVGQDLDTVRDFVREVLPNPSGTTSYTMISDSPCNLHGLDNPIDYGAGNIDARAQIALVPNSMLVLGVCIKDALEDIVLHRCDESIDRLGDWIRSVRRPVFLRIGYELNAPWNSCNPKYYRLAFKWIVSRLRFRGVENFVSVWQSYTYLSRSKKGSRSSKNIDRTFADWFPGRDVVDWMGTSYFNVDKHVHDAFLNFARSKGKPVMITESAPQGYDLELGTTLDVFTNQQLASGLTGKEIWLRWFKPYFKYINENRDVIRAVCYINTPWKTQKMWSSGEHGFWGDSRIQVDAYIKSKFLKQLTDDGHWLLASSDFMSMIHTRP